MPSMEEYFFSSYERFLGLEPPSLSAVVYGRGVDLALLVADFAYGGASKVCCMRALNFCLFALFLFSNFGCGVGPYRSGGPINLWERSNAACSWRDFDGS